MFDIPQQLPDGWGAEDELLSAADHHPHGQRGGVLHRPNHVGAGRHTCARRVGNEIEPVRTAGGGSDGIGRIEHDDLENAARHTSVVTSW